MENKMDWLRTWFSGRETFSYNRKILSGWQPLGHMTSSLEKQLCIIMFYQLMIAVQWVWPLSTGGITRKVPPVQPTKLFAWKGGGRKSRWSHWITTTFVLLWNFYSLYADSASKDSSTQLRELSVHKLENRKMLRHNNYLRRFLRGIW